MPASRVGYVYDSGLADYIPFTGPPAAATETNAPYVVCGPCGIQIEDVISVG